MPAVYLSCTRYSSLVVVGGGGVGGDATFAVATVVFVHVRCSIVRVAVAGDYRPDG